MAHELATNEEIKWHQRARYKWLAVGDRNTRYFHALASSKKRRKTISNILYQGSECAGQNQIMHAFLSHYKKFMGTREALHMLDITTLYEQPLDLHQLQEPFTNLEVHRAICDLASNKASGPDGLPNKFAKHHWQSLQPHIMHIFQQFFSLQADLAPINETRIVLVPKVDAPNSMADFHPINNGVVDLFLSFPDWVHMSRSELRVKSYVRFKIGTSNIRSNFRVIFSYNSAIIRLSPNQIN